MKGFFHLKQTFYESNSSFADLTGTPRIKFYRITISDVIKLKIEMI